MMFYTIILPLSRASIQENKEAGESVMEVVDNLVAFLIVNLRCNS